MKKPLLELAKLQDRHGPLAVAGYMQFPRAYYELIFTMLYRLLEISDMRTRREDSFRLQKKIVSLIADTSKKPFYDYDYKAILSQNKNLLNHFIDQVSKRDASKAIFGVDELKNLKNFIKQVDKFEERFC